MPVVAEVVLVVDGSSTDGAGGTMISPLGTVTGSANVVVVDSLGASVVVVGSAVVVVVGSVRGGTVWARATPNDKAIAASASPKPASRRVMRHLRGRRPSAALPSPPP